MDDALHVVVGASPSVDDAFDHSAGKLTTAHPRPLLLLLRMVDGPPV